MLITVRWMVTPSNQHAWKAQRYHREIPAGLAERELIQLQQFGALKN
jgi:hypothetical protein